MRVEGLRRRPEAEIANVDPKHSKGAPTGSAPSRGGATPHRRGGAEQAPTTTMAEG
jgi:hypothetical protein